MGDHHTTPDQLDPWFRHAPVEGNPQHEHGSKVDTNMLFAVLVVLVATVAVFTMGVAVFANGRIARIQAEREMSTATAATATAYRLQAKGQLETTRWIDRAQGTVQLSLEEARRRVLEQHAN